MKEKHIILRSMGTATRDVFLGALGMPGISSASAEAAGGLSVEVENIDRSRISALTHNSEVIAVAPAIPMKLIAPVKLKSKAKLAAASGGIAWGVQAVGADTSPFTGDGVTVAVLDTGIDAAHPAFAGVELIQKDFTREGNGDLHGHGTHCAGTIFGRDTNNTRIGVAVGVKRALIGKVLGAGGGSSDQLVSAIQWAVDEGANVISMSLGIDFPGLVKKLTEGGMPTALATSRALEGYRANVQLFESLARFIRAQGMFSRVSIIVAAAGNESQRNTNANFEIAVSPPAVAEGVISVAAVERGKKGLGVASFSNTGANIAGPGVDIISAKKGGGLVSMNGTSMATPHVAGVAALWAESLKQKGGLSSGQLANRLTGTASFDGLQQGIDPFDVGAGLIRAPQS